MGNSVSPRRRRSVTMQDVADLLHVSKQTVSAVVNNKPGITNETRERVLAAIAQVNYRMDMTARSLRTGRTNTVALVVTDVSSPILSMIAMAVEEHLYAAHYNLVLFNTHDDLEREQLALNSIAQRSIDGVLFVAATDESGAMDKLAERGIPAVVIDRVPQSYHGPAVVLDNYAAGRMAAEHLLGLGHRRLAHIAGPPNLHIARERLEGFRQRANELAGTVTHVVNAADWRVESGYAAMRAILAQADAPADANTPHDTEAVTAVFCAGDMLAIGAMHAIAERGLAIPEDIAVIGLDDIDLAAYLRPSLTTISQSSTEMARRGVDLLLSLLVGEPQAQSARVIIEPRLIVRRSTAPRALRP